MLERKRDKEAKWPGRKSSVHSLPFFGMASRSRLSLSFVCMFVYFFGEVFYFFCLFLFLFCSFGCLFGCLSLLFLIDFQSGVAIGYSDFPATVWSSLCPQQTGLLQTTQFDNRIMISCDYVCVLNRLAFCRRHSFITGSWSIAQQQGVHLGESLPVNELGRVISATSTSGLKRPPCQTPGVTGSVLELVGPLSLHNDWRR